MVDMRVMNISQGCKLMVLIQLGCAVCVERRRHGVRICAINWYNKAQLAGEMVRVQSGVIVCAVSQ